MSSISSSENPPSDSSRQGISLYDYWRVLSTLPSYRIIFIAFCVDNIGNWLTFIACLTIIDRHGKDMYTSLYLACRLLPALLFAGLFFSLIHIKCKLVCFFKINIVQELWDLWQTLLTKEMDSYFVPLGLLSQLQHF